MEPKRIEHGLYEEMLVDPEKINWKAAQFADVLGVAVGTIYSWDKKIDWDEIKNLRRKRFARATISVDLALFRKAKTGDVAAIRTWYERFDFWTPTQRIQSENKISDIDLEEAIKNLVEQKRAAEATRIESTPKLGEPGGVPAPETGGAPDAPAAG